MWIVINSYKVFLEKLKKIDHNVFLFRLKIGKINKVLNNDNPQVFKNFGKVFAKVVCSKWQLNL